MFMENLKKELNSEKQLTENGAVGYRTSGKKLLDLNFKVSSFRSQSDEAIEIAFSDAFFENPLLAIKWLFYGRDARGGIGERRLFRISMKWLAKIRPELVRVLLPLIPEYGRWDDVVDLLEIDELQDAITELIRKQLLDDVENMQQVKPVSLCSKWMPRVNTSSAKTKEKAKLLCRLLGAREAEYRKTISMLNKYLQTVEVSMSAQNWKEIDYAAVPSGANLLYRNAFLKHDETRRKLYLEALEKGETKINASVLFPHDIVHRYMTTTGYRRSVGRKDTALEELWKALPNYVNGAGNTIVVADGSGSMTCCVGNTEVMALDVANALAIYFAEHSTGQFKDNYITFSTRPQLVDFSNATSLQEKIGIALQHCEVADTNIKATFDLILQTAIDNKMSQEDIPANILIISDMEFNRAVYDTPGQTLFDRIAEKYEHHGYKLPHLVFWNVNSRTGTVPVQENSCGVALVSGFSPAICNMVLSGELDPFQNLLNEINKERYNAVETAVMDII